MRDSNHRKAPVSCPVCEGSLSTTRLSCSSCGTELVGEFGSCAFCSLNENDLQLIKIFLSSRGNLREIERFLGVSYPTARARYAQLMKRLGLDTESDNSSPAATAAPVAHVHPAFGNVPEPAFREPVSASVEEEATELISLQ
ncbi:MAG: DUF2089 domain-containing protein [Propionibacteriaceae bacterium]|nr:DUF2089 domain-containing protein [Propionibacteriaceae bacterium]